MKVLVTGSRNWRIYSTMFQAINDAKPDLLIHGGARGADTLAGQIAHQLDIPVRVYPADWASFGKSAGKNRNLRMLQCEHMETEPIDMVLAFPMSDSIGTYHMMDIAHKAGIIVYNLGDVRAS